MASVEDLGDLLPNETFADGRWLGRLGNDIQSIDAGIEKQTMAGSEMRAQLQRLVSKALVAFLQNRGWNPLVSAVRGFQSGNPTAAHNAIGEVIDAFITTFGPRIQPINQNVMGLLQIVQKIVRLQRELADVTAGLQQLGLPPSEAPPVKAREEKGKKVAKAEEAEAEEEAEEEEKPAREEAGTSRAAGRVVISQAHRVSFLNALHTWFERATPSEKAQWQLATWALWRPIIQSEAAQDKLDDALRRRLPPRFRNIDNAMRLRGNIFEINPDVALALLFFALKDKKKAAVTLNNQMSTRRINAKGETVAQALQDSVRSIKIVLAVW